MRNGRRGAFLSEDILSYFINAVFGFVSLPQSLLLWSLSSSVRLTCSWLSLCLCFFHVLLAALEVWSNCELWYTSLGLVLSCCYSVLQDWGGFILLGEWEIASFRIPCGRQSSGSELTSPAEVKQLLLTSLLYVPGLEGKDLP